MILVWNYLIMTTFFVNQTKSFIKGSFTLPFTLYVIAGGLTLVIAGWVADVCFGRYRVMRFSMWIVWFAYILITAVTVITELRDTVITLVVISLMSS